MFAVATPSKAVIVLGKGNAGNSVYWEVYDNGTLYIYGYGKMKDYTSMSYPVWNAYGIKKVVISKGVTSIGSYAFFNCRDMTAISIPSSVTTIGSGAFLECPKLAEVHVESIDAWCKLTNAMDSYGYYINPLKANSNNKQLYVDKELVTHLVIPNGVTSIAQNAFYLCATVTSVEIPDTVTSIGAWAFLSCEGLTAITVPESVTSIEMCAFAGCIGLKEITLPYVGLGNNPGFSFGAVFGDANFTGTVCTTQRYLDTSGTTQRYHSYYIPSGLSKVTITGGQIPAYAFENCSTIESVVLPDGITEIKSKTFSYCINLRSVDLPEGLIAIGDGAFSVTNLDSITIPEGVEVIDERAFSECYSLETMIIPDTVISIGSYAFLDCASLEDIYYGGTEAEWAIRCDASTSAFVHYSCVNPDGHWSNRSVTGDCTSAGYTVDTCPCGYEKNKQPTGEAPGHKEVIDAAVAATCTTDGKTEGKHCSVCGTVTKAQEVVKATEHSFTEGKCITCGAEDPNYVKPTEPEVTEPEVTEPKPTEPEVTEPKPTEPEVKGVTRVFGTDRYATAFKAADTLKAELGVQKFQNVIVASGTGFADALAGSYLAAVKNAPILLVRGANVNDVKNYIKANLASGGTVYLLGGVNAVPQTMETGLDGFKVKRLGGADRYTTNLLILQEAGVGNKDIIVCTGLNFADSLSASATGLPILLVKGGLTDTQKAFLKGTSGKKIIVGGTSAVSVAVENQLKTYGSVKRLAGNTRYDTSVLVAKEFFKAPKSAVLAYAQNFPDGLSGGPLAYTLNAPLILTDSKKPTAAVTYATGAGIKSGYVLGGTGLISDKVVKNIFSMDEADAINVK